MSKRIFCNDCQRDTNHALLGESSRQEYFDEEVLMAGYTIWRMWSCLGCEQVTLEELDWESATEGDGQLLFSVGDEEAIYSIKYIPERSKFLVKQKRFSTLPNRLEKIYQETLHAYNSNLHILCGIGIRTLIEGVCADQEISGRNLQDRIDGLTGLLPQNIVTNLHSLRFMGNEAAHELIVSDSSDLRLAIEICEDLLNIIYDLDYKASQLARSRQQKHSENDSPGPTHEGTQD